VDDIVITFADGHKLFIQAKENIASGDSAWNKAWKDFDKQFQKETFQQDKDRLCLQIGNLRDEHDKLSELCIRASTSNNFEEWQGRLTNDQKALLEKVKPNLSPILLGEDGLLDFFSHIVIEKWPLTHIEQDLLPFWMPETTKSAHELFRLFRDRVGGEARIRGSFTAQNLRKSLESEDPSLLFVTPTEIDYIRSAIKDVGSLLRHHKHTIGDTDYHIDRPIVDEIVNWVQSDDDSNKNVSILVDQAGMGKSVVLHDRLH